MIGKKDLIAAVLLIFCFTATLFIITPSSGQSAKPEYDSWLDLNEDGKINILDFAILGQYYQTSGTPINKTDLLLNLIDRIGKLTPNDVIIAMNGNRIRNGDDLTSYLDRNRLPRETVILRVARLNQTLEVSVVLGKRPPPPL